MDSRSGETFENANPADTRDILGIFQNSGAEDVDLAVDIAAAGFVPEFFRKRRDYLSCEQTPNSPVT